MSTQSSWEEGSKAGFRLPTELLWIPTLSWDEITLVGHVASTAKLDSFMCNGDISEIGPAWLVEESPGNSPEKAPGTW